jgi:hypothetical protein
LTKGSAVPVEFWAPAVAPEAARARAAGKRISI